MIALLVDAATIIAAGIAGAIVLAVAVVILSDRKRAAPADPTKPVPDGFSCPEWTRTMGTCCPGGTFRAGCPALRARQRSTAGGPAA